VRFVATVPRVGQRTGVKDDAHRLSRYLSGAMRQSAQGRCTGPGWPQAGRGLCGGPEAGRVKGVYDARVATVRMTSSHRDA
jgi:hypothetical protein